MGDDEDLVVVFRQVLKSLGQNLCDYRHWRSFEDPAAESTEVIEEGDINGVAQRIVEDELRELAPRMVATAVEAMYENDQALGTKIAAVAVKVQPRFIKAKLLEAPLITRIHHCAACLIALSVKAKTDRMDEVQVVQTAALGARL